MAPHPPTCLCLTANVGKRTGKATTRLGGKREGIKGKWLVMATGAHERTSKGTSGARLSRRLGILRSGRVKVKEGDLKG